MNSSVSSAITSSAIPISGSKRDPVASWYSSSTSEIDTLVTLSGPSCPVASSLICSSAFLSGSSSVSRSRTVATPMGVPSLSVPVITWRAARACSASGAVRTYSSAASICSCVTEPKSSVWSRAAISSVGR